MCAIVCSGCAWDLYNSAVLLLIAFSQLLPSKFARQQMCRATSCSWLVFFSLMIFTRCALWTCTLQSQKQGLRFGWPLGLSNSFNVGQCKLHVNYVLACSDLCSCLPKVLGKWSSGQLLFWLCTVHLPLLRQYYATTSTDCCNTGADVDTGEPSSHTGDLWRPQWRGVPQELLQELPENGGEVPPERPGQEVCVGGARVCVHACLYKYVHMSVFAQYPH